MKNVARKSTLEMKQKQNQLIFENSWFSRDQIGTNQICSLLNVSNKYV